MSIYRGGNELRSQIEQTGLPEQALALWALGQAGFLVKWQGIRLLFDPYLSNSVYEAAGPPWMRAFASPLVPEECDDIDYVICSHHHDDHMDKQTLVALDHNCERTIFIVPRSHLGLLRHWGIADDRMIGISHGETLELMDSLSLEAHAAKHEQFEQDDAGEHLYLGYVVTLGSLTLYHAGDTIGFAELAAWLRGKRPDIGLLPINGRDYVRAGKGIAGNCNYREAIELAVHAQVDLLIPMHYGMFPHNDENPAYFVDYLHSNYPSQRFHMFVPGERYIYMK